MLAPWKATPYPTHKSPLEGIRADLEPEWLDAASTDPVFALRTGRRADITTPAKLNLLQLVFWPALARWVESRQRVYPDGSVDGGWWRADMMGMLDWYRTCLKMTSRYQDAIEAHADGVWRTVLKTSPWWDWPEFWVLLWQPVLDEQGRAVRSGENNRIVYKERDPYNADMEDEFMDLWTELANKRPLKKHADGTFVLPVNARRDGPSKTSMKRDGRKI